MQALKYMKNSCIFFLKLFVFLFAFPVYLQAEVVTDGDFLGLLPKAEFVRTSYDFQDIYRGQKVSYFFDFINKGKGVLSITSIHSSCGCFNTQVLKSDKVTKQQTFDPGERGSIFVEFDSKNFQGNVIRVVTVDVNMGSQTSLTLTLSANVIPEISVEPHIIVMGNIDKDVTKTFTTAIQLNSRAKEKGEKTSSPVVPTAVSASAAFIKPQLVKGENNNYTLKIDLLAPLPIGPIKETVVISSNAKYLKDLEIPIVGEVLGHVNTSAKYIEFGVVTEKHAREAVLTLSSPDKRFDVTSIAVRLTSAELSAGITEKQLLDIQKEKIKIDGEDGIATKINIKFKLSLPKNVEKSSLYSKEMSALNISGSFVIKTNDPDYKEIIIPFFGLLRKNP